MPFSEVGFLIFGTPEGLLTKRVIPKVLLLWNFPLVYSNRETFNLNSQIYREVKQNYYDEITLIARTYFVLLS